MRFKVFQSKETFVRFILHRIGETEEILRSVKCPKYDQPDCERGIWKIMVHRPGVTEMSPRTDRLQD